MSVKVKLDGLQRTLARMDGIAAEMRGQTLIDGLTEIGDLAVRAAKQLVPQPGSPHYSPRRGERKSRKKLLNTIAKKVGFYRSTQFEGSVLVVGPGYPAGAHGHLVEYGHRIAVGGTLKRLPRKRIKQNRQIAPPQAKKGITGGGRTVGESRKIPFIAPAFREIKPKISPLMIKAIGGAIKRALRSTSKVG